jgi:Calcineurin-like phosphoesterase
VLLGLGGGLTAAALAPGWDAPPLPEGARFSLLAVGDSGHPAKWTAWLTPQRAVGDALEATHRDHPADELLLLGDNFYPAGLRTSEAEARIAMNLVAPYCAFLDLGAPLGSRLEASCPVPPGQRLPIPVRAVLGNHDWQAAESPDLEQDLIPRYLANFELRKGGAWVEETPAGVSLVFFDSTPGRSRDQVHWLREALAASRGPWRIVVSHHPIAASPKGDLLRQAIAEAGVPLHIWLAGHEHNLQIGQPGAPGPALQVIAGAGSAPTGLKYDLPGRRFFRRSLGYARIDLVDDPAARGVEQLVVSLVEVRPVPAAFWQRARVVSRWSVSQGGAAHRLFQEESDPPVHEAHPDEPLE